MTPELNGLIYEIIIIICISFISAFSISLNNYANDKMKKRKKDLIPLLYISETLISGLSGFFLSMISMLITKNIILWFICAGVGGFAGRKLLFVVIRIAIIVFSASKNIDVQKLQDISDNIKTVDDKKGDT